MMDCRIGDSCNGVRVTRWWDLPLGVFFLLVPFVSYLFTVLMWFLGFSSNRWTLIPGVIVAFVAIFFSRKIFQLNKERLFYLFFTFLFVFLLGTFISIFIYDYAYDGMLYHQPIIYSLMKGWNPVYEANSPHFVGKSIASFVNYYPKGMETMAAVFSMFFQDIEAGKVVNLLFLSSAFCFSSYFVNNYFSSSMTGCKKTLLSVLLCYSPVTIVQLLTYYVDWSLYYIILSLGVIAYDAVLIQNKQRLRLDLVLIGILMALASSIKITVMFWSTLFLVVFFLFWKIKGLITNWRSWFFASVLGLMFGLFVLAFNPYVHNVIDGRFLFHPFLGEQAVNVDAVQEKALGGCGRVESVFLSLTSRPSNNHTYKGPFELSVDSAIQSGKADVRLGGFGLFFIEIFLFGLLLFVCSHRKQLDWYLCGAGLVLLILFLFLLPNGWWARFCPYFYFVPLICLFYVLRKGGKVVNKISSLMIVLMLLNVCVIQSSAMGLMLMHRSKVHYLMDVLEATPHPVKMNCNNWALENKLKEHHIQTNFCDTLSKVLIFPGSPVFIAPAEWREDLVDKNDYFLLKYSNIKNSIVQE